MHAIGLFNDDDFLLQFNLSFSTENIMSSFYVMQRRFPDWQIGSFIQKNNLEFAKILTPFGVCYTFNTLDAPELFDFNK